jgi:hypothetical protein
LGLAIDKARAGKDYGTMKSTTRAAIAVGMIALGVCVVLTLGSCKDAGTATIERRTLFKLGIGKLDDQLDLFQTEGDANDYKTRLAMRDGIVFIANGNGHKVLEFSSYGDLLYMQYNPDKNAVPVALKPGTPGKDAALHAAFQYPLISAGEIAATSDKDILVEDKLPDDLKVFDSKKQTLLDGVILRFSRTGALIDYLGQEGIGGTPFPFISGLNVTVSNEIVVTCLTQDSWFVFWYSAQGNLLYKIQIDKGNLPIPDGEKLIPSLEKIAPDAELHELYLKLDYYRESIDPATKTHSGVDFDSTKVYIMDVAAGKYIGNLDVPVIEKRQKGPFEEKPDRRVYEFLGAAQKGNLFFMVPDDNDSFQVMVLNARTRNIRRRSLGIKNEELFFNTFSLSNDGILSAILASNYEAQVVWWRTDSLIGEIRQ